MTDNNHPITPPSELVREWQIKIEYCSKRADREAVVAKIFQLGADMELEACCEWLEDFQCSKRFTAELRAARRPKPPSLKKQALAALDEEQADMSIQNYKTIRSVLESLPDEQ
jgi:hypothetical protein